MNRLISRRLKLDEVEVEPWTGEDGQGLPSYDSAVDVEAWVRETDEVLFSADGSEVRMNLKAHLPADSAYIPAREDRWTYDARTFIVRDVKPVKAFNGVLQHTRIMLRDE